MDDSVGEPAATLASSWEDNAEAWIAWTGERLDSYYGGHRDAFLGLVPPPAGLTLDLAAGEGRLSRELRRRGHRVLAVDRSPTLTRFAARHADEPVPAVIADAAALPLSDRSASCAVGFMCLHDIDDLTGAMNELGRVLVDGGVLVLAIVHPINSAGGFAPGADEVTRPYRIDGSYTRPRRYVDTRVRGGRTMVYHGMHRPLQAYTDALFAAGFVIERLREQATDDQRSKWSRIPLFLHIVASRRRSD